MKTSTMRNLPEGFKDEADSMSAERLKASIIESSANLSRIENAAENDEAFQKLKAAAKDAGAGYSDGKKAQAAKIDYALHLLEQRGAVDLVGDLEELLAGMKRTVEGPVGPKGRLTSEERTRLEAMSDEPEPA